MVIKIDILGDKELNDKLSKLPEEAAHAAIGEVQDYMLNVLRSDQPSPNFVTRKSAYGVSYFSERQRRFLGWLYSQGLVPYHRTQALSKAWHIIERGLMGYLQNDAEGAEYVIGEEKQSRHEKMVGWKKPSQQIRERADKINKIIDAAAKKAIKKLRLG